MRKRLTATLGLVMGRLTAPEIGQAAHRAGAAVFGRRRRDLASAVRRWVYDETRLLRWCVNLVDWEPTPPSGASLSIRLAAPADLDRWPIEGRRLPAGPPPSTESIETYYVGLWDAVPMFLVSVSRGPDASPFIRLAPDEVEVRGMGVLEGWQGCAGPGVTLEALLAELKAAGVRTVYAHVERGEVSPHLAYEEARFVPVALVTVRTVLGIRLRSVRRTADYGPEPAG